MTFEQVGMYTCTRCGGSVFFILEKFYTNVSEIREEKKHLFKTSRRSNIFLKFDFGF